MKYAPPSLLTVEVTTPVAVLVAVILTPGKTAPDESATVPVNAPLTACPNPLVATKQDTKKHKKKIFLIRHPPIYRAREEIPSAVVFNLGVSKRAKIKSPPMEEVNLKDL